MSYAVQRFATRDPTCCAVCRRHAWAIGYAPRQGAPIIWVCDHTVCQGLLKRVYKMPKDVLDAYEIGSAKEAINEAGPYLDEIGNTDLATLEPQQMSEFLTRFLCAYEAAMRRKILNDEAPF